MTAPLAVLLALSVSGLGGRALPVAVVVDVSGSWSVGPGKTALAVGTELAAGAHVSAPDDATARLVVVSFDGQRHECSVRASCRGLTVPKPADEPGLFARLGESLRAMLMTEKGRAVFTMSRGGLVVEPALVPRGAEGLELSDALVGVKGPIEVSLAFAPDSGPLIEARLDAKRRVLTAPGGFDGHAWVLTVRDASGAEARGWVVVPTPEREAELRAELGKLRAKTSTWRDAATERRVVSAFLLGLKP